MSLVINGHVEQDELAASAARAARNRRKRERRKAKATPVAVKVDRVAHGVMCVNDHAVLGHMYTFKNIEEIFPAGIVTINNDTHTVVIDADHCAECIKRNELLSWIAHNYRATNGRTSVTVHNVAFLLNGELVHCSFRGHVIEQKGASTRVQLHARDDIPFCNVAPITKSSDATAHHHTLFRAATGLFCVIIHGEEHCDRTLVRGVGCKAKCNKVCGKHTLQPVQLCQ